MKTVTLESLCNTDFVITDIAVAYSDINSPPEFDYEKLGRSKNLIYYQIQGSRHYYRHNRLLLSLQEADVVFIPDGYRYRSTTIDTVTESCGIGVSFQLRDPNGEILAINDSIKIIYHDLKGTLLEHFHNILFAVLRENSGKLKMQRELFYLLDTFLSGKDTTSISDTYKDILSAINIIENHPENSLSVQALANLCYMSESTFVRRFKKYSGGIPPTAYRNRVRVMYAEEMLNTSQTLEQIAVRLGFYDAAHLCCVYKKIRGKSIKKR